MPRPAGTVTDDVAFDPIAGAAASVDGEKNCAKSTRGVAAYCTTALFFSCPVKRFGFHGYFHCKKAQNHMLQFALHSISGSLTPCACVDSEQPQEPIPFYPISDAASSVFVAMPNTCAGLFWRRVVRNPGAVSAIACSMLPPQLRPPADE
ncbi:hypothetical protein GUJ93_ZPchr0003g17279 [Zizania palustris]|uniref:Uncharacterized protein n=1 Tax=Zizania palustris TaxID=103762 RepID=A0A8J5SKX8_ZIZPA|nr:hypothetical protein GUJ93_ZPchr0003g17279 [Zizania palustris]